jgi:hypothetical protein
VGLFEVERQTALLAEDAGEAVIAMVRWGRAADAATDLHERIEAVAAARRCAERALHEAVWRARCGRAPSVTRGVRSHR